MGRIDEALRRSNLDVARGVAVATPEPNAAPWQFDAHEPADRQSPIADPSIANRQSSIRQSTIDDPQSTIESVPRWSSVDAAVLERLVVSRSALPLLVEQFRSLAATLHGAQLGRPLKSVIVTSASPGDGKSHVAVNLALTLSESYRRRVLLIDADLRRPSLHRLFAVQNDRGLSEALNAKTDEKVPAVQISDTLTLLPAGRPQADPLGGLSSDRMKRIVEDAAAHFDWVIVDSPPVGLLADGRLVSESVDGALLVVRAGATRFPDLEAAADTMGRERILGIVLNGVDPVEIRGEDYYRHYYGRTAEARSAD